MKLWKKLTIVLVSVFGLSAATTETVRADTHTDFINRMSQPVLKVSRQNHLYGSVMMAQAALESNWGTSELSLNAHNYFGVKGNYDGHSVTMSTAEANPGGSMYNTLAQFKVYPSAQASLRDYAKVLRGGTTWNPFLYEGAWRENASSYMTATNIVAENYATDKNYASKLNKIILDYDLHDRLDRTSANSTDADTSTRLTPGVDYDSYDGTATVKPGTIKFYNGVPTASDKAKVVRTKQLANKQVKVMGRGIVTKDQTIWYQVKSGSVTGWIQITDILGLKNH
ncbi:lysozyme [Secundilactobacillus pentosiphilus]|uniref:Lysozyme n=1 Tax=Secundilactobacillus pentosiphilus TaxID=1714682 RepID=A0A1Z5IYH3_9LACO|nr:glucosaminidase domain-containing protein [Secundilactobacillus pentosiphilus]GAX06696.1 lysozyme [Secundilactobacillus pentosiphilus]